MVETMRFEVCQGAPSKNICAMLHAGLDALLFPNEPQADLVLPLVQTLSPNLSLSTLGSGPPTMSDGNSSAPWQGAVRMVMTQSVSVDRDAALAMSQPVVLSNNTIIVGNTLRPDGAILDLSGLTCLPGSVGSGVSPQGERAAAAVVGACV